jgi:hypothetical protein
VFNEISFTTGSISGGSFMKGNLQEVIVYNRALSESEIAEVRGYLNLKYKIY